MNEVDFLKRRVLLLGGRKGAVATLRSVLAIAGVTNVLHVEDSRRALDLLSSEHFDAVFCDRSAEKVGGLSFPAAARASNAVLNPMIPIFELHDRASRGDVERARDVGVTDILVCPISPKTITTKLGAALVKPRPFVAAPNFFGPDRRALRDGFGGSERRVRKPKKAAIDANGGNSPV